jgi:hypothetical protein
LCANKKQVVCGNFSGNIHFVVLRLPFLSIQNATHETLQVFSNPHGHWLCGFFIAQNPRAFFLRIEPLLDAPLNAQKLSEFDVNP